MKRHAFSASALLAVLLASACSSDAPPAGQPALPADKDDTKGTIRFTGAPASIVARQPGDVIVAGKSPSAPRGFVRAVVSVQADGADTVVETMPIPLQLAFKNLHVKLAREVADLSRPPSLASSSLATSIEPRSHSV